LGSSERLVEGGTEAGDAPGVRGGMKGEATLEEGQSFGLSIKPSLSLLFSSSRGLARKLHPSSGRNLK